jgi:hypothetical protein
MMEQKNLLDLLYNNSPTPMADLISGFRNPKNSNEKRWLVYHKKSPRVFEMFSSFASELVQRGYKNHSARAIIFRIRWETMKPLDDFNPATGEALKISDHHSPYYGRLWMEQNPNHPNFFRTKKIAGGENDE